MARSTFRLQPLLKLRQAARDRCREELAHAHRADEILQSRLLAIEQELGATRKLTYTNSLPGRIEVDNLLHAHRYELMLSSQLRQLHVQREKIKLEIERRRQALVEADRELRVLEKLRERHCIESRQREAKREMQHMDELALRRSAEAGKSGDR